MLDVFKALSDPYRLRLLAVLLQGEFTVQELTSILRVGQSKISWHLKILAGAGIISVKRQGTWSYYRAGGGSPFFAAIFPAMGEELERLPERADDRAAVERVLEERRRRSREFFDRHACQWDDLSRRLIPVPDYRERLLELVPERCNVVEIGFGTGELLPALAARGARVTGIDGSPAMLEEARRRLALGGIAGIELKLGDMHRLPLADDSAGCVVLNMVLHHAPDPAAVLKEIGRVLAPGGLLLIADLTRHEMEWVRERLADQWFGFEPKELASWLAASGFGGVSIETVAGAGGETSVLLATAVSDTKYTGAESAPTKERTTCPKISS